MTTTQDPTTAPKGAHAIADARARLPEAARRDFLDALSGLPVTAEQQRYLNWAADMWDQPTLNAFADVIRAARAERERSIARAEDEPAAEQAEPVCGAWNDAHDCHLPADHSGDHLCAGCADVWNRGPWDDDAGEWEHQRPEDRCTADGPQPREID